MSEPNEAQIIYDEVDQVKLFQLYVLFGGDTHRVAVASRAEKSRIESLAHDFNWRGKLNGKKSLATEEGLKEEREMNRAINYVVADQLHNVFNNLISELNRDPVFARQFCTTTDDAGMKLFNTKNLVELAKGVEIVSNVKYRALGDKVAQEADVTGGPQNAAQFSLTIYQALQKRFDGIPKVDIQAEVSNALKEAPADSVSTEGA